MPREKLTAILTTFNEEANIQGCIESLDFCDEIMLVDAFSTETGGVRNVRIDIRRRDMAPEADVTLVGVLGMDIKPRDGSTWYSIRLLFGQRQGRWSFLKAYHELPADGPVWTEASGKYRAVAERALGP